MEQPTQPTQGTKITRRELRPGEKFFGGSGVLIPYRPQQTQPPARQESIERIKAKAQRTREAAANQPPVSAEEARAQAAQIMQGLPDARTPEGLAELRAMRLARRGLQS